MSEDRLQNIMRDVMKELKKILENDFVSAILYGSYARGDYDHESDIDFAVLVSCDRMRVKKYTEALAELMVDINLEYDVLVSFCCIPIDEFNSKKDVLPYYRNIDTEGVKVIA